MQDQNYQNQYNQQYPPQQNPYQNPYPQQYQNTEPVTIGEWIITMIVTAIPIVGIIMLFVWAFGRNTKVSRANYCKAALIMTAIVIALYILIIVIAVGAIGGAASLLDF